MMKKLMATSISTSNRLYLDSNLVIYYKEEESPFHQKAINIIETSVIEQFTLTVSCLTLDESIHGIVRDLRIKKEKDVIGKAKSAFKEFLNLSGLEIVNPPSDLKSQFKIFSFMEKYNLHPRDAYHLLIMKENKIKYFATFDNDFERVFKAETVKRFVD